MPGFSESILTDVGLDALTDAEAGSHIEYTHMEAGDGFIYGGNAEIYGMTQLVSKKVDFPITNFSNDGDGQITLVGTLSSKNVTTGFYFRELAVRCTIDSGVPILYTVSYAGETGDYIPGSAEVPVVVQTVQIIIRIDRAPNVTVIVQPGLDVTCQNIGLATVGPGWFRDKIGQICWFKRINSPKKTLELSETPDLVSIDVPAVTEDLDLWVALGNPDIFPHYSTIQKALDYLFPKQIKAGITATIHVAAGVWTNSGQITVNHSNGSQIKIIGEISAAKTVTSVQSLGTNLVRLNAPAGTFSGMVVGDYIYFKGAGTYAAASVCGVWPVTAVAADGSSVSYTTSLWGTWPLTTVLGGTAYHMKTVVFFNPTNHGFHVRKDGLGLLKNIVLRGTSSTTKFFGLYNTEGLCTCEFVGAFDWKGVSSHGFLAGGTGRLYLYDCSACNNETGISSGNQGSYLYASDCHANGCNNIGFEGQGGDFFGYSLNGSGNKSIGVVNTDVGSMSLNGCNIAYNRDYGVYVQFHSHIGFGPSAENNIRVNGVRDITLTSLSSIIRTGPATNYATANIAPNVLSADGCYFSP